MRLMSAEQEQMLQKLVDLAEGDIRLVEEAMALASVDEDNAPIMEDVIEYILKNLHRKDNTTKAATG
jgi:hypothetical protein